MALTNKDFEYLTKEQSPRLRAIAKKRVEANCSGEISMDELKQIIKVCAFSGDKAATKWLKNLQSLIITGAFMEVKEPKNFGNDSGTHTFMTHVLDVHRRCQRGELPFDINERVLVKETGKMGMVADYNDNSGLYIIILDPFQVVELEKKALIKKAHCGKDHTADVDEPKKTLTKEEEEAEIKKHEEFEKGKKEPKQELKDVKDEELDDVLKGLGKKAADEFNPGRSYAEPAKTFTESWLDSGNGWERMGVYTRTGTERFSRGTLEDLKKLEEYWKNKGWKFKREMV